jgi:hypothetical protein
MAAPRFTLLRALALVAWLALLLAFALRWFHPVAAVVTVLVLLALSVLPLFALETTGRARSFWVGFAAAGWARVLYVFRNSGSFLGWLSDTPSGRLLDAIFIRLDLPLTLPQSDTLFMNGPPEYWMVYQIGQSVFCLAAALLGGCVAVAMSWACSRARKRLNPNFFGDRA